MHAEAPSGGTHSSTGPGGTSRTTTVGGQPGNPSRTTTATNGDASRTTTGSANTQTGNYNRSSSGSSPNGSYSTSASGNAYTKTATRTTTATNKYGQTYSGASYAKNGYVYHGAVVTNPIYHGYPAWGWNGGYVWAPVPYYYGGGFWGGYATGLAFGYYTTPASVVITSYEVQPSSPGAKLLAAYQLTQVQCGAPNLVVIMGSDDSVICAKPNSLVAAGTYGVDETTLTLTSIAPK